MTKLIDYVCEQFSEWAEAERPGDTGYYLEKDGPLYGGGLLGSDFGFRQLQDITCKARRKYPTDPLAEADTRDLLRAVFDQIPHGWPTRRRIFFAGSLIRYLAELD